MAARRLHIFLRRSHCVGCAFLKEGVNLQLSRNIAVTTRLKCEANDLSGDRMHDITNISRLKPPLYSRVKGKPFESPWQSEEDTSLLSSSSDENEHDDSAENSAAKIKRFHRRSFLFKTKVDVKKLQANIEKSNYGKYGRQASKIDLSSLWPSPDHIERENAKLNFFKPVAERIEGLRAEKQAEKEEIEAHQKKISENMAKMDLYLDQYRQRKTKRLEKSAKTNVRTQELLAEAREFFGYDIDKKDIKFQQMVEWKEEEAKRAKKKSRKEQQANVLSRQVARLSADLSAKEEAG